MTTAFQKNAFQHNAFQIGDTGSTTVIDTVTYSRHPINCMMVGNKPLLGDWTYENEWTVTPRNEKTISKATVGRTSRADFIRGLKI